MGEVPAGGRRRAVVVAVAAVAALAAAPAASSASVTADAAASSTTHRLGARADGHDTAGPLDLRSASIAQTGPRLAIDVRTFTSWRARDLRSSGPRTLCLDLIQARRTHHVCAGAVSPRNGAAALRVATGSGGARRMAADVRRPNTRTLRASFDFAAAGLRPGRMSWRVVSHWSGGPGCVASPPAREPTGPTGATGPSGPVPPSAPVKPCVDRLPDRGTIAARVRPVAVAGCVERGPHFVFHGPRSRRLVAMTFDDGPNPPYTRQILDVLRRNRVHATFFVIGQQVRRNAALVRRELAEGHVVGNHTYTHASVGGGGYGQMKSTIDAIRSVTHGYRPCVFRFPYGASGRVGVANAHSLGMGAIQWDVDPTDWARPGSGAIYSRVVSMVRPGSIILDHDGGGPRNQTVAALPHIIHTLESRGYRFVTVPELLGYRTIYR